MAKLKNIPSFLLVLSLFLAFASLSLGQHHQDPREEFRQCQRRCQVEEQGRLQQKECEQRCEQELSRREREQERGWELDNSQRDPRQQFEQCQERCRREEKGQGERQQRCERTCREEFERQQERHRRDEYNPQRDPRQQFEQCQERCRRSGQGEQRQRCERACREEFEREQERHRGNDDNPQKDPKQQFQECQERCRRSGQGEQQQRCERACREQFERQREQQEGGRGNPERESQEEEMTSDNPYFFHQSMLQSRYQSREGHIRVLGRFTERSELLRGIENYRLGLLAANPNTFIIPHHIDAEQIFVVLQGRCTIFFVRQERERTESFHMENGEAIRVPSGTTVYLVNRDNNEQLRVASLFQPVNTPGQFREYFAAGGENPQSIFNVFSNDVLEAALNNPSDRIQRLLGQQREGVIIRARPEQIKSMTQHVSSRKQHKGEKSTGSINVLQQKPQFSNNFGQFFEASPDRFRQLKEMGVSVSFVNIKQGGMLVPHYNTRSTRIILVLEGTARVEMACPHLGSQYGGRGQEQQEQETGVQYQRIRSRLNPGDIFIVPAGHPVTFIANDNLRTMSFGINAENNEKVFLAGKENMINQLDREAKELAFGIPASEVEEIFQSPRESYFVAGPSQRGRQQREEGRRMEPLSSILKFVGF